MKILLIAAFICAVTLFMQSTQYSSIAIEVADFRVEINIIVAIVGITLLFIAFYFLLRVVVFIKELPSTLKKKIEALRKKNELEIIEDILVASFSYNQPKFERSIAELKKVHDMPGYFIDICKYGFYEQNGNTEIGRDSLKRLLLNKETRNFSLKNLSRLELKAKRYDEVLGYSMQLLYLDKHDKEATTISVAACILSGDWKTLSSLLPYIKKSFGVDSFLLLESIVHFKIFIQNDALDAKKITLPSKKVMDLFHPWIFLSIRSCISRSEYEEAMGIILRYWDIYKDYLTPMVIQILISNNDNVKLAKKISDPLIEDFCNVLEGRIENLKILKEGYYEILLQIYKKCSTRQFLDIDALLSKLAVWIPNIEKYYYLDVENMQLCDNHYGEFCYKISGIANFIKCV
ncbi:HemN domain protein [Candidatus Cyrtobacter comes]|uniref:HemN domain protein n=1 Tax=Candidatus Cyrtobacter comes TaxID=675776 RepID=A0ABU5L8K8_9RICK|nr:heme biosynthesis HemY N-terminal domain-containing protein [Candidatus Cyrtobacter comes]MDZ5762367.1 HemN domain protein [Candidatus Cyrtobacter comes]